LPARRSRRFTYVVLTLLSLLVCGSIAGLIALIIRAIWVSAIFAAVPLVIASRVFRRRDIAGE
jgi:hypothetical protein